MATERRVLRLQQLILEAVAETVQRDLHDPRIGLVSITRVKLAPDLSAARVFWSCLGEEAQRRTCARGLKDALPVIQRHVATVMRTRITPQLSLAYDATLAKAERLERIFQSLREERGDEDAEAGEAPSGTDPEAAPAAGDGGPADPDAAFEAQD